MNERDYRFDNIKGIMIFLVVFCHTIEKFQVNCLHYDIIKHIYFAVYSFHMPVFIFISGYFSENNHYSRYYKSLTQYLIPYIIINTGYDIMYSVYSKSVVLNPFIPNWILWFLLSLFFWNLLIDIINLTRFPISISIIIGLLAGCFGEIGLLLSLSRIICFFPFFIVGNLTRKKNILHNLQKHISQVSCVLFIFAQVLVAILVKRNIPVDTFYLNNSYSYMQQPFQIGMLYRVAYYIVGFIGILFFMSVIPNVKTTLSTIGRYSMMVYLSHQFIIVVLSHLFKGFDSPLIILSGAIVFSTIICLAFGNKYVNMVYQFIFDRISALVVPPIK